jgi:2-dehydropantoate 2-reductase
MSKRIVFVGAGAIGGYVGGLLFRNGHDVTLIDPWPEHVETIRARGLEITGMSEAERCVVPVPVLHLTEVQRLIRERPVDIAVVAMKSYDTEWATMLIRPYLAPDGYVVSLQNCINEERIAGIVGWGRTVGCIAARLAAELIAPGQVWRTCPRADGPPLFYVGEPHGRVTPRLTHLAEMLRGIDSTEITTNLWGERWAKLCVNAMRNGVSAVTGLAGNARDRDAAIRAFAIQVGGEAVRVGQALGFDLGAVDRLDPERLALAAAGDQLAMDEVSAIMIAGTNLGRSDKQRPSMAQDIAKGRRTESDFINGHIVERAGATGLRAPANAYLTELVRKLERGQIGASPDHITDYRPA